MNDERPTSQDLTRRGLPLWMRLLGVRRVDRRVLPFGLTLWAKGVCALVILLGGLLAFAEYSMHPDFCRTCHIMEPYYQAWHESTHKDVPCGDCHFAPGWRHTVRGKWEATSQAVKYITRTYGSKPHAQVQDASCLRSGCHDQRLLEGESEWTVPTMRGDEITIRFDHTPHLGENRRGKELRCVSCHSQIVQGQHIVVTLDSCFTCHFKGVKHGRDDETLGGCGSCHGAPKGEIRLATGIFNHAEYLERGVACENCHSEAIKGDGEVPRQMCWNCHNVPQHLARYGETTFIHRTHITDHKVACSNCHIQIEHHLTANAPRAAPGAWASSPSASSPSASNPMAQDHHLEPSGMCGQCHEGMHAGPSMIYRGVGGRGVPDMPSPMHTAQVDCIACHTLREHGSVTAAVVGQTWRAAQAACDYCHGNRYDGVLDIWKRSMDQLLADAEVALERATAALARWEHGLPARASRDGNSAVESQATQRLRLRRLLNDAEANVRLVRLGHGVHNVTYSTALLNVAMDYCEEIVAAVGEER